MGPSGSVLNECAPIKRIRLQEDDVLTLHINRVQVQASYDAFAAILGDGAVVAWGHRSLFTMAIVATVEMLTIS